MADQSSYGLFIPTTQVWDQPKQGSEDPNEMVVRLHQNINSVATALNLKDSGYYNTIIPFVTGQQFFPNPALNETTPAAPDYRPTFRLVINFGAFAGGAASVAHGLTITAATTFTRIYGVGNNTATMTYNPLPNPNTNITVTAVNVTLTGTGGYDIVYVILEYMTS
jgi:hypothetical protein